MFTKSLCVGSVVESYDNGVVDYTYVAVESLKQALAEVRCLPLLVRLAEALAQLVDDGLCDEGHCQLSVSNMEVECAGAVPSHGLVGIEEFFEMPAVGVVIAYLVEFVTSAGRKKGCEVVVLRGFSAPLN